jgi:aquaporin Z
VGPFAGLGIGLTLVAIHIVGIQVTGVSVNPARSLGPAVWVLGDALGQLWLFIVAPLLGAGLAGLAFRAKLLNQEN